MKWMLISVFFLVGCSQNTGIPEVIISETTYQDIDHFMIKTQNATYYYDMKGGGFSRILDREGNDWIGFVRDSVSSYPASAASSYRGLPNLVFGGDDNGAGHPGFEQCRSQKVSDYSIQTESISRRWQWKWSFFRSHAKMEILKTDTTRHYWFLYEGPAGGKFMPVDLYWGHDQEGPLRFVPDYNSGERSTGNWQWIYFGLKENNNIFFIAQDSRDKYIDMFAVLGNSPKGLQAEDGMIVAGFGRKKPAEPLLYERNTFYIGFIEGKMTNGIDHSEIINPIRQILD